MGRVARALIAHELLERGRDRWVVVATLLFAVLAGAITLYGRTAGEAAAAVTAPSLVTLSTLLVPLVALILGYDAIVGERERHTLGLLLSLPVSRGEVLLAKFLGRALALCLAIGLGLGTAAVLLGGGQAGTLLSLVPSTLLLGVSFLSLGVLLSAIAKRHATAATLAVTSWFLLVFVWDMAVLGALVATNGALSQEIVGWLVTVNPTGLYRTALLASLVDPGALTEVGMGGFLPGALARGGLWVAWILGPLGLGALLLLRRKAVTA